MTDFHLGLLVVGVLAVAGVLFYNRLQERRVRRAAERAFRSGHADALLDEPRREPTLGLPPRPEAHADGAIPDPKVDYVMVLSAPKGIPAPLPREHWAPIALRFARRALLGPVEDGKVRVALQLVSRDGVASEAELLEFRAAAETLAARIGASIAAPEMRAALEAARELDRICAEADIQVALHVVGIAPPAGIEASAFRVEPRDDGVTLSLDVGRTADPGRAYQGMARAAVQLAASGGGRVVDDNGATLDERALAAIGAQLEAIRAMLAERGVEPGSPLALRVFS
ncbi:MAG TPA: cell division protein ZipA C-terminal FtsZ-binding domain-containing protein [Burkholderiales bacterium]|nr:cell division protein ZipA C-terminal FtsZ-binding domain-containing protein [Burkholderiales bacterium]